MILCLKKVEVLLDTIAQLADREFILLARLRWTLKHEIKRYGQFIRRSNGFLFVETCYGPLAFTKTVSKNEQPNFHTRYTLSFDVRVKNILLFILFDIFRINFRTFVKIISQIILINSEYNLSTNNAAAPSCVTKVQRQSF